MSIEVQRIDETKSSVLRTLLDRYLQELASFREKPVGATDAASYPYLPLYWTEENRFPFLIWSKGELAGFALVHRVQYESTQTTQMAEFFIVPEKRRQGIGFAAVHALWKLFPGSWELQVLIQNESAIKFWFTCMAQDYVRSCEGEEIESKDGRRLFYHFIV